VLQGTEKCAAVSTSGKHIYRTSSCELFTNAGIGFVGVGDEVKADGGMSGALAEKGGIDDVGERRQGRSIDEQDKPTRNEVFDTTEFTRRLAEQSHKEAVRSADRLAEEVLSRVPAAAGSPDRQDEVADGLHRAVTAVLDGVFATGFDSNEDDGQWAVLGAQRARAGDDESDVLLVLDLVRKESFDLILDVARRVPAPSSVALEVVIALCSRLEAVMERARRRVLAGFGAELSHPLTDEAFPTATLVDRLLLGRQRSGTAMTVADIGFAPGQAVVLGVATLFPGSPSRPLADGTFDLAGAFANGVPGPVRRWPQPHAVVLAPFPKTLRLEKVTRVAELQGWAVAVVGPIDDADIAVTYKRLSRDLFLMPMCTSVPGVVTTDVLEHHRMIAAASIEEQTSFVHRVLAPVFELPNWPELLACVNALFETPAGIEGAARRMGIHDNTFRKYLKIVENATNLSTRVPGQAHRLFTAARLTRPMMTAPGHGT
jgi:hypothetical protein